jgi:Tetratricopeptide repeat
MGLDRHRVMEVFIKPVNGRGRVGSGYRVNQSSVLTAGHVVTGLPVRSPAQVAAGNGGAGRCELRVLGEQAWMSGSLLWLDESADVAVIGLPGDVPSLPPGSPVPRLGRVDGMEPIAVSAVGFPWAQERPDRVRDSEQLFGFIAPATTEKAGLCAVTVQTAAPAGRDDGSPWAGMSGAALFAGPFLVGVVVIDPARFGTDRVVAAPIAPLLADADLAGLLDVSAEAVTGVGPRLRLAVTAETSLALAPPYRAATPRLGREPTRLLLPEYGIVPFAGRDGDLDTLQAWCLDGTGPALRRITGAGGSGKTRLAAEACVRMTGLGWQAGFADPKAPGGRAQLEFDRPTLLVIDDADLNVALLADLVRAVSYWPPGTPPVRLLLLARHTTGWWDTLNQRTGQLAGELADAALELHDGKLTPADRVGQHTRALAAFAAHLPDPVTPGGPMSLADPAFANPLLVHMHALLTVCGAQVPATSDAVHEQILDAVLDRERDRWAATFPAGVPTGGARTRQQAVTVATLLAPPTEIAAGQAMTVIDELAPDAAAGARAAVATWLRGLYPGSEPPWVAPLRPDLLAEQLLATCAQLTDLVLAGYARITMPGQAGQILTELTRAGTRLPVRGALDRLLQDHLRDLVTAAIDTPTGRLPDLLDHALQLAPQPALAAALADQLPEHSVQLAALTATVMSQQVTYYRAGTARGEPDAVGGLARSLNDLSVRLGDLGRREQALAAIQEAVTIYRELAADHPDAFRPGLALSLNNLSNHLAGLGRREDALAASQEATQVYRELAAARPDAFRPDLAGSLNNLSNHLGGLGRREDALAASREATDTYRELAADHPDTFRPYLATSLGNLSAYLADLGRREDALAAIQEAVTIHRELAAARPDAFRPDLATSLTNLSVRLADLGRREDALAAIREAVTIYRELAAARPDAFRPGLAASLTNLSVELADLDRPKSALAASREAADTYRELAAARPDAFRPGLAGSLNNLSVRLGALGRRTEALAVSLEAVTIYRELAAARPDAFRPGLAASLNNLSAGLASLRRRDEALAAIREAADTYRELAAARPDAFWPDLAMALTNLSAGLASLGRREEALAASREAATIRRELAAR